MADEWFAEVEGRTLGPVSIERIREWSRSGRLTATTRVKGPDGLWTPAAEVPGLLSFAAGWTAGAASDGSVPVISLQDTAQWDSLGREVKDEEREPVPPLPRRSMRTVSPGAVIAVLAVLGAVILALLYWMR